MKSTIIIIISALFIISCTESNPIKKNLLGSISGQVNGEPKLFSNVIDVEYPNLSNSFNSTYKTVNMGRREFENADGNQWRIYLQHVDIDGIELPYTITEVIADAPYAEIQWRLNNNDSGPLYIGATFYENISITLTRIDNDVLSGTFSGTLTYRNDEGEFVNDNQLTITDGKFKIKLVRE